MSKLSWKERLQAVLNIGEKIVALIATTSTGDKIEFKDLAEDATPQEGDVATINGEPAQGEITIVNGDESYTLYFVDGVVTAKPESEDEAEMQALKDENAELKASNDALTAQVTAMRTEVNSILSEITSEESPTQRRTPSARETEKELTPKERLVALRKKKAGLQ